MDEKIEKLIAELTLEEKISMLAGATQWTTVPVERLGIPAIKMTDGPNGARGSRSRGGPTSVCFPVGVALAATWNAELVGRVGKALAEEVKAKGAHVLLAPTVNIHRSPLAGRHFECYSEDPYLTGSMAAAIIDGLQRQGVGACIKHFVCNDSEFERHTISSEVGERAFREVYLFPFRMAVRKVDPWCVMSAYNKVNGTYCSENAHLLLDILKGEWGFEGIVMSDWGGTYSPDAAQGGLDLEMPGPGRWMGAPVLEAVKADLVSEDAIDDKVRRLLKVIDKAGAFEDPGERPERAEDKPEHRLLAREAAAEALVLLKNEGGILPLDLEEIDSIAVIGENAARAQIQGGGSAHVSPHYVVSPLEGITSQAGDRASVGYEIGCVVHRFLPLLEMDWLTTEDGAQHGLAVHFFDNPELSGDPVQTEVTESAELAWFDSPMPALGSEGSSARLSGRFAASQTGRYTFSLTSVGRARLLIDGQEVIDNWTAAPVAGEPEKVTGFEMIAGRSYDFRVEHSWEGGAHLRTLRLGCQPPISAHPIADAVALAGRSDVAVVFAGLTNEWESEGEDRPDMDLRGDQDELIERVAAANPRTIVVLNSGAPLAMPWLDRVAAVVQAWYPGQEAGNAIGDLLFGAVNPSGRLPTTFPRRLKDTPAYINYPGENGQVHYGEGIFVGYRYYDKKDVEPLFPFGYGLSYTTFGYGRLVLNATEYGPGDEIRISVDVVNTGACAGKEVVQLYVRDVESTLMRPEKELKAFAKVSLEPDERKTVTFTLDEDALSFYDPGRRRWVAEAGDFEILVGSSSRDIRQVGRFAWRGGATLESREEARLHIGLTVQALLDDEAGRAVLEEHFGAFLGHPAISAVLGMTLEQIAGFVPQLLTPEKLKEIDEALAAARRGPMP
jgi:beta-glucosidase